MKIQEIKAACEFLFKELKGIIRIYLFGSATECVGLESDIDLLVVVEKEIFKNYVDWCSSAGLGIAGKTPLDPWDNYWNYFSPQGIRLETVIKILRSMLQEVGSNLSIEDLAEKFPGKSLDIIMLPFGWMHNKKLLKKINKTDPNFSKNLLKSARLIFS